MPRPTSLWVAGRTGFGPMGFRKSTGPTMIEGGPTGLFTRLGRKEPSSTREPEIADKPVARPIGAQITPDEKVGVQTMPDMEVPAAPSQSEEFLTAFQPRKSSADVGGSTLGTTPRVTSAVMEVYRRREGPSTTPLKGSELSVFEVGLVLCETRAKTCAPLASGLLVGDTSGGGDGALTLKYLGESSSCHHDNGNDLEAYDNGDDSEASSIMGFRETEEVKDFPFMQEMSHAMEVNNIVRVSCDGQTGLLVGCFKRIIVETHGKGGGGIHSTTHKIPDFVNCPLVETHKIPDFVHIVETHKIPDFVNCPLEIC